MGLMDLLGGLGKGIAAEATFTLGDCSEETQQAIWSKYVAYRRAGYVEPFHVRRSPYKIKMYHMGSYIVKEYTGARETVEKEVSILRQLHHENLVGFLFVADQGNRISIVMDWAGESLREHRTVAQPQQYCEAVARHMMYQLTSALVYLHQRGIIHRDIKPDNIGVHVDHKVQLFDWGEALSLSAAHNMNDRALARVAGVAGTPLFMPPEVLNYLTDRDRDPKGEHHLRALLTTKIDVWGLGAVLFFLLAGRDIFVNDSSWDLENLADIASASCGVELPLGVEASCAARDFLRRCLCRDPDERASAKELMQHPWLMGAATAADMEAFHAAQARHDSGAAHRTALLSVLAESFSSDGDDDAGGAAATAAKGQQQQQQHCAVQQPDVQQQQHAPQQRRAPQQPVRIQPAALAAIDAASGASVDPLSASLALASGVASAELLAAGAQQQQQHHSHAQQHQHHAQQHLQHLLQQHHQGQWPAQQHQHQLPPLACGAAHRRLDSLGSHKSLAAEEEAVTAAAAAELQKRAGHGEAVCEVRLRVSNSATSLASLGTQPVQMAA